MDHLWIVGAPLFGAMLLIVGAVLPFKSNRTPEVDGELLLVSASAEPDESAVDRAPSIGKRIFSGLASRVARRAPPTDLAPEPEAIEGHLAEKIAPTPAELAFTKVLAECETPVATLADFGAEARAAHDRAAAAEAAAEEAAQEERASAAAEEERRQRELEEIAVAQEARVRAEARARRWYVRLDPDMEAPTVEERMALASWLAIPAPFAAKLLLTAFEQEDVPRVRARIVGALAGGEHFADPLPFQVAYDNGGIEKAAVWEVLAPRRESFPWVDELLH